MLSETEGEYIQVSGKISYDQQVGCNLHYFQILQKISLIGEFHLEMAQNDLAVRLSKLYPAVNQELTPLPTRFEKNEEFCTFFLDVSYFFQ